VPVLVTKETFTGSLPAGVNSATHNLTLGQTLAQCVPYTSSSTDESTFANRRHVRVRRFAGPDRIVVDRGSTPGTSRIDYTVVVEEYDVASVAVQYLTYTVPGSTSQTNAIAAISAVRTLVVGTMRADPLNGDSDPDEYMHELDLFTSTLLRTRAYASGDDYDFAVYIPEALSASVWRVFEVPWILIASTSLTQGIGGTVDMARTWLWGTYRADRNTSEADLMTTTVYLLNTNQFRVEADAGNPDERRGTLYVVETAVGVATVQRGVSTIVAPALTGTGAIAAVDVSRSRVDTNHGWCGQSVGCRNDYNASGGNDAAQCESDFNSPTQVGFTLLSITGGTTSTIRWEVVSWLIGSPGGGGPCPGPMDLDCCIVIPDGCPVKVGCA
jgi:hypothetical protein